MTVSEPAQWTEKGVTKSQGQGHKKGGWKPVAVPVSRKPKRQHSGISSSGRETETGTAWAGAAAADDDIVL